MIGRAVRTLWALVRREAAMLWAFWSVRVNAALAVLAAWVMANPGGLDGLLDYVPERWRAAAAVALALAVFVIQTAARRAPQRGLQGGGDGVA